MLPFMQVLEGAGHRAMFSPFEVASTASIQCGWFLHNVAMKQKSSFSSCAPAQGQPQSSPTRLNSKNSAGLFASVTQKPWKLIDPKKGQILKEF